MKKRLRLALGLVILAASLAMLTWGFWPARRETRIQVITPGEGAPPSAEPASTMPIAADQGLPTPANKATTLLATAPVVESLDGTDHTPVLTSPEVKEARRLVLEFPPTVRVGDSDVVRLRLELDPSGNVLATAEIASYEPTEEVLQTSGVYETHTVVARARLDVFGIESRPTGTTSEPLLRGQPVTFYWSIRATESGRFRGTVWLHLQFTEKASGRDSRKAVSAQIIEIEAVDFLGLSAGWGRTTGTLGAIVGAVLSFPFIQDILRRQIRRQRRRG